MIVVVPRLVAGLVPDADAPPLGERVWGDTRVHVPDEPARCYRHALTGACVPDRRRRRCALAEVFEPLPRGLSRHAIAMFWTLLGIAFIIWFVLVLLFTPRIDYHVTMPLRPDSDEFLHVSSPRARRRCIADNRVDVFTNGAQFYPAMRDAIRGAETSVNLEAYIFQPGDAADMLVEAMIERARAGVEVRLVLDAIGSAGLRSACVARLRGRRVPGDLLPAPHLVPAAPAQQPHPPRAARRGRRASRSPAAPASPTGG